MILYPETAADCQAVGKRLEDLSDAWKWRHIYVGTISRLLERSWITLG